MNHDIKRCHLPHLPSHHFLTNKLSTFHQVRIIMFYQKEFFQASERVKSIDVHPSQPWILTSLYSGTVCIWNYLSQKLEKSFKVTQSPVRSAKFIAGKTWIVVGADDMYIRVYDYYTMAKIKEFEAHQDFIRCVAVHSSLPYVLSCSDDMVIKLWDWEKDWACSQVFEGHSHYVMHIEFNPKDPKSFASASLDGTIKIWNLDSPASSFTLEAQSKGINCIAYFTKGDKPCIIAGSDDYEAKVWDCETKSCLQTLEGHRGNVSAVCVHPKLSLIFTGSEDGTVRVWHAEDYRLQTTLNFDLGRVWTIRSNKSSNQVVFGCDMGTIMVKITGVMDSQFKEELVAQLT